METVRLSPENIVDIARNAVEIFHKGGVVLFPTDTLYGLGADAFSNEAVDKIYAIKGRDEGKPIHALVASIEMAEEYAEISELARLAIERLPKGKVTYICKKKSGIDSGICRYIDTFGFRIPDNDFCIEMVRAFGKPVTATSANLAGGEPQRSVENILAQLGYSDVLKNIGIDLVVDGGELPGSLPSTVISFAEEHPLILREGAVLAEGVWDALRDADGELA